MSKGIFRRIFFVYAVIVFIVAVFVEIYITAVVRQDHITNLRKHLSEKIHLIATYLTFTQNNYDAFCREMKAKTHARVTIILSNGRVIGDSDHDSASMDNHANRVEIQQADDLGEGMTIRHSDTLRQDLLYVAERISRGGSDMGFIRLAVPLADVDLMVNMLRVKIVLIVFAVLFITLGVSVWQIGYLRRLLKQITEFSRSLSKGEIDKRLFLRGAGEFSEIADNLTSMSVALQGVISQSNEERNRLNVILKSVPDALLIIDIKGVIILSSSSAQDFFGQVRTAGLHFTEAVRNHKFSELIEQVKKSSLPGMTELGIEAPAEKHLSVRVSPLYYNEGELSGFIAIFHDITEMKKLEQVRKDFVANVSHELKTPITAIKGFADTLLDGALGDQENARRFVETIRSNSERINALVDDLMTISKIELGVIKVEKAVIGVEGIFENIIELFKARAVSKNLSLTVHPDQDVRQVEADRNRLIQILTNLVDNALKFTETGGVTFGIDKDEQQRPYLFVEDTGIGVPAKFVSRLGERFFRVDPARSRKMGGTGLGLAIVKHLVRAHGWNMKIESIRGKGTKVKIIM